MRPRIALLAVLALAVVAQLAATRSAQTAAALQSASGVDAEILGEGTGIQLYEFTFAEGGRIDQQRIEQPMLVYVEDGSFVVYIRPLVDQTISFRFEMVDSGESFEDLPVFTVSSECSLPLNPEVEGLESAEYDECTFTDSEASPSVADLCEPDPVPVTSATRQAFDCEVTDAAINGVGILVRPGTTLVLPGPTECMICELDADPSVPDPNEGGVIEVAVAAPPDEFIWYQVVAGSTQGTPSSKRVPASGHLPSLQVDPCNGLVR